MRFFKQAGLILSLLTIIVSPSFASDAKGTKEEAKALSEKAATLVKAEGEKAFATFQNKDGGYIDRDLYVFVLDDKGTFVSHGTKPVLVGKGALSMKDVSGFPFVKAFVDVKDAAWVNYKWPDPADAGKVKDKASYIIKVGKYAVGVGYYK